MQYVRRVMGNSVSNRIKNGESDTEVRIVGVVVGAFRPL